MSVRVRSHAFLVSSSCDEFRSVSGDIRFVRSYPLNMFKTSNGRHRLIGPVGERYSCVRYAVCPVVVRIVRFSCVQHPVGILYVSVDVCERINYRTGNRVPGTSTACAFCDHSTNVLSVSYTVHIRFVRYTSVTLTLVDRSLSITCSVRMRSLQHLRRLPSPDKQFLHFFCLLDVRCPLPLSVDM